MSPRSRSRPRNAARSARRGPGAWRETKSWTCSEPSTVVFIQRRERKELRFSHLVIAHRLHRLRIAEQIQRLDDCLHPLARDEIGDSLLASRDRDRPFL